MRLTTNWLASWARFTPERLALHDEGTGRSWTYAELYQESLDWAAWLAERGVGRGDRVAVLAHNRGETLALFFACAERAAMLFPMNWRLADGELEWQVGNAEPKVVLCDEANSGRLWGALPLVSPAHTDAPPVTEAVAPADPWVLMYTSGSSGRPKGALLTHGQIFANAVNTQLACRLTSEDSTLTFAPLFHTGGLNCLTSPLFHAGGSVVLTPALDVDAALRTIEDRGISVLMGVPTIYQMLADAQGFDATDLSSVRDAICGGAALPMALLERYAERDIPLRQGFGLTEVGPNCFSLPQHQLRNKAGTVGLPIHHIEARVFRDDGTECEPGEPGELWLRGPSVCGGYWRNPEATAASFADGWFRTGDILTMDAEGYFTVSGRKKEMFISGGENVYPAEVEAAISDFGPVALAAVVAVPDERWGEVGHAYVQPRPGFALDTQALVAHFQGRLARFKQPKCITVLDELPRTGSGKIDKPHLTQRALQSVEAAL